jgi:predicted Holliday junction resolvase-like endonuclease
MTIAVVVILAVFYALSQMPSKPKAPIVPTVPLEHFKDTVAELNATIAYLRKDCEFFEKGLQELKSQQQSKSVRLGQISEQSVGLLPSFPFDIKEMRFLGSPIDYVAFDFENEKIYFLEVKTGKSKLNERQKIVKRMIENKAIEFIQLKITENGVEYE